MFFFELLSFYVSVRVSGPLYPKLLMCLRVPGLSQIHTLTSKITQVCQDICDIKLRRILITCSYKEPNTITTSILTNQNDRKDTSGSSRNRPGTLDIREDLSGNWTCRIYVFL